MTSTEAKTEKEFIHTKKGSIWGYLLSEASDNFVIIEITRELKGKYKDYKPGEHIQIRRSLLENL